MPSSGSLADSLHQLESQSNSARVQLLRSVVEPLVIQGTNQVAELRAYEKMLAEAERNARSDPNNPHWLEQLSQKTIRHDQCLARINALIDKAVAQIDLHARQEAVALLLALANQGFLPPKPPVASEGASESMDPLVSSVSFRTLEKNIQSERKERDQALRALRQDLEAYKALNNARVQKIEETHKQEITLHKQELRKLKTTLRLAEAKRDVPVPASVISPPLVPAPPEATGTSDQRLEMLKSELLEHVGRQMSELQEQIGRRVTELQGQIGRQVSAPVAPAELDKPSLRLLVDRLKEQLEQLGKNTTSALSDLEPEIRRATTAIQAEVTKAARHVISDGHDEIASLVRQAVEGLHARIDKLEQTRPAPAAPSPPALRPIHSSTARSPPPARQPRPANPAAPVPPSAEAPLASRTANKATSSTVSIASRLTNGPTLAAEGPLAKKRESVSREPSWLGQSYPRPSAESRAQPKTTIPLAKRLRTEENHDPSRSLDWRRSDY